MKFISADNFEICSGKSYAPIELNTKWKIHIWGSPDIIFTTTDGVPFQHLGHIWNVCADIFNGAFLMILYDLGSAGNKVKDEVLDINWCYMNKKDDFIVTIHYKIFGQIQPGRDFLMTSLGLINPFNLQDVIRNS